MIYFGLRPYTISLMDCNERRKNISTDICQTKARSIQLSLTDVEFQSAFALLQNFAEKSQQVFARGEAMHAKKTEGELISQAKNAVAD